MRTTAHLRLSPHNNDQFRNCHREFFLICSIPEHHHVSILSRTLKGSSVGFRISKRVCKLFMPRVNFAKSASTSNYYLSSAPFRLCRALLLFHQEPFRHLHSRQFINPLLDERIADYYPFVCHMHFSSAQLCDSPTPQPSPICHLVLISIVYPFRPPTFSSSILPSLLQLYVHPPSKLLVTVPHFTYVTIRLCW